MSDSEEILYEPRPKVVSLKGNRSAIDHTQLMRACWLLRRYSSYSYLERTATLFKSVVDAYDAWAMKEERLSAEYANRTHATLHEHQNAFRVGLANMRNGFVPDAYNAFFRAVSSLEPTDPRDERSLSLSVLLDELGGSVAKPGTVAAAMAQRAEHTLAASWAYEIIFANRLSLQLAPRQFPSSLPSVDLPSQDAITVHTENSVPQTGIWLPVSITNGCPNFLVAGFAAPQTTYPCQRIDYAELKPERGYEGRAAWSDFEYETADTSWRLMWADTRYDHGVRDEDPSYLDDENSVQ